MGGDFAPLETTLGAIRAQKEMPSDSRLVLIGDREAVVSILNKEGANIDDFELVNTTEVIGMSEHPTKAITQKPDSSIAVGFNLLKEGKIDAFASAGNTGAMLVGAIYSVKMIAGIMRPCIASSIPKEDGSVGVIVDVGANPDCKPEMLNQFAILGSLLAEYVYKIKNPKVGLLNIGEEEEKGCLTTQAAHQLMKNSADFNFIGNVEGRDIYNKKADVIVCDGFTGNVVLKQAESFYTLFKSKGLKNDYFDRFNYENVGGTPVLGINSTVIIGHGISNANAIKNMILLTREVTAAKLSDKIKQALEVSLSR